ncbi:MAG: DNA topoisomerase IV subunit B [Winkia neuii]|uniref:DNA gyrase/topoisomerase IV subunit B n=1 Tax=Winkia neuii TaxID=33007 RepID=UPI002900E926|nr:DNA topoisomerase IV subunit B [Winkia neuii]MDU3134899.1 DNA topoisomerase IV subunit B [Winkia neuii]
MSASQKKKQEYNAQHLTVLEGLDAVRKRPGMYIGSTDRRGLMHCVWEIVDNAVDEAVEGYCDKIVVTLHPDHSVSVSDNGRGIPVDNVRGTGKSGVEVVYTKLHAGGKFDSGNYAAAGGLHGVGASVVNALSARLDVQVDRGGNTYQMCFKRGQAGIFDDSSGRTPESPFTPFGEKSELAVVGKTKKTLSGTRVRFWDDFQIFPPTESFDWELLLARARQTCFLVPTVTIECRDERGADPLVETFHFSGGIADFVEFNAKDNAASDTWSIEGDYPYKEMVQEISPETGHLAPVERERNCHVSVALRWGTGYETDIRGFVNIIATPKGGTHITGFEQAVVKVVRAQIEKSARKLKVGSRDGKIEKDDVLAGLTAVVTVSLPEPQFEGQTKEILGTVQARQAVNKIVTEGLKKRFTSSNREDKSQTFTILEKVVGEMRARVSARVSKEISRRKNALETSSLPAKLADCRTNEVSRSELFIVEGDSALGTAKVARNSEFQALFPIRGKILNVQKSSTSDMLSNAECSAIIQVVGAGSGRSFDIDAARYSKIVMMTDADVDGAHIRTLLLTLFFRYMRPLIEQGRVYAAVPPLHRIEVAAKGRKPREYIYTYSEAELHQKLAELKKAGRTYKEPIQRYKGLGEMDADQLAETTMEPQHRTLRRVTLEDEAALQKAEEVFELLMGSTVPPRRDFIVAGSHEFDRERIDA